MPPFEDFDLNQKAVLWPTIGRDRDNEPLQGGALEIDVRWETKRSEGFDAQGNPIVLQATVVVDRQVNVDDTLWLGELADWLGTGSAGDQGELMRVASYSEVPDIKGRNIRRTLGLMYFKGNPPEGA